MIRKKISGILAASALVCAAATVSPVSAQELDMDKVAPQAIEGRSTTSVGTVINCPEGLNLRKGASTGTAILRLLPNGAKVNVLSTSNGWHKVEYNGIYGYVYAEYIKVSNTSTETSMKATGKVVNTDGTGLNLRSKANTTSSVLMTIKEGATFTITAKTGSWYKVSYSGKTGYVHSDYVKIVNNNSGNTTPSNQETSMKETGKVVNTGGTGLNLRSKASTSSSVLMTIKEGATLTVTAKTGSWYKVSYSGKTGYVHSDYVKIVNNDNNNGGTTKPPASNGDVAFSSKAYVGDTEKMGLFMRTAPNTSASVVMTIPEGAVITITAKNGVWYKVNYGGKTGYAHSSYIELGDKPSTKPPANNNNGDVAFSSKAYVGDTEGLGLFMRTAPNSSASVVMTIPEGAVITITAKNGVWYKVNYGGKTGYAHSSYIELGDKPTNSKATFENVFNIMKAHIGTPYVWGGSGEYITDSSIATLKSRFPYEAADGWYDYIGREYYNKGYRAFDCSGLMQWGFAQVGINIGRTTYTQVNAGRAVSRADVQPGDLLITNSQGHVGMYIGNGQWIESPAPGYSIRISNVNWNNIGYIRRVL